MMIRRLQSGPQSRAGIDRPQLAFGQFGRLDSGAAADLAGACHCLDGKVACGSASKKKGLRTPHLVGAWTTNAGLTLGQVGFGEKSNAPSITAGYGPLK
jgi:hypothetical protein